MAQAAVHPLPVSRDATAVSAVVVTILIWASAFPAIRAGLQAFGPLELGAARFAIAGIPALRSRARSPSPVRRRRPGRG